MLLGCAVLIVCTAATLGFTHRYFLGGTESDFLGTYLHEASNFLSGKPLLVDPHPPLYSITVSLLERFLHDWLLSGKTISFVCSVLVVLINLRLFAELAGLPAAAGVLLAFAASFTFFSYAAFSTSDMFFLSIYSTALWAAFKYSIERKNSYAFLTGIAVGLSLITRENAVTLVILLSVPLFARTGTRWISGLLILAFGTFVPLAAWYLFARASHSPFYPSNSYINLGMTYFSPGPDRTLAEAYADVASHFHSFGEVLRFDPKRMMSIYARDFVVMLFKNTVMLVPVVGLLGLAGFGRFIKSARKPFVYVLLISVVAQIALINFKTYEYRFYLFLVPLWGAAAGRFLYWLSEKIDRARPTRVFSTLFLSLFFPMLLIGTILSYRQLHPPFERELASVLPQVRRLVPPGSAIYARKESIPFYADSEFRMLPMARDIDSLHVMLPQQNDRKTFIYFGSFEYRLRPGLRELINTDHTPPWLTLLATVHSRELAWCLYEVHSDR